MSNSPNMQEQRLLTIVIATFNRGRFLKRLLESIAPELRKHADAVEVLIVDDGSTDNTPDVIAQFIGGPLPFRTLRNRTNLGLDGNLRYSFLQASTEYAWIFGDDDVMLEGTLDLLIPLLRRYRACATRLVPQAAQCRALHRGFGNVRIVHDSAESHEGKTGAR